MTRRFKIGLAAFLAVVVAAGLFLRWQLQRGYSARDEPSAIEAFIARRLRALAAPSGAHHMQNPLPETAENLAQAMAHFADHCALCHANDGSGQSPLGLGLYPKPPDLRQSASQSLSDGEIFYIIRNGIRLSGMPAFGETASEQDEDTWKLVHFIRHLPKITPEELERMKEMNPKSQHQMDEEEEMRKFLRGEEEEPKPASKPHKH